MYASLAIHWLSLALRVSVCSGEKTDDGAGDISFVVGAYPLEHIDYDYKNSRTAPDLRE